jgi:hypothetical protein
MIDCCNVGVKMLVVAVVHSFAPSMTFYSGSSYFSCHRVNAAGEFQNQTGQTTCQQCPENMHSEEANSTHCESCGVGATSEPGSAKCQQCGAGTFGDGCQVCPVGYARKASDLDPTQCQQCNIGETTWNEGAATCQGCGLGKYGHRKGTCRACAPGQYQDSKGETTCKECDVDTYLNEAGKSSKADCQQCSADRNTRTKGSNSTHACQCTRGLYYQTKGEDGEDGEDGECAECPKGADCNPTNTKDGVTLLEIIPKSGYWRPFPSSVDFLDCQDAYQGVGGRKLAKQRCCPFDDTLNASVCAVFNHPDEQCLDGYKGVLCRGCTTETHVVNGDGCVECVGGSSTTMAVLLVLGLCAMFYGLLLVVLLRSKPPVDAEGRSKSHKAIRLRLAVFNQGKLVLNFLQVLSSMDKTCDAGECGCASTCSGCVVFQLF